EWDTPRTKSDKRATGVTWGGGYAGTRGECQISARRGRCCRRLVHAAKAFLTVGFGAIDASVRCERRISDRQLHNFGLLPHKGARVCPNDVEPFHQASGLLVLEHEHERVGVALDTTARGR